MGYAHVSTEGQLLDRQIHALTEAGRIRIFADKKSGKNAEREELWKALGFLREGDTLVVPSLDRLGRSLQEPRTCAKASSRKSARTACRIPTPSSSGSPAATAGGLHPRPPGIVPAQHGDLPAQRGRVQAPIGSGLPPQLVDQLRQAPQCSGRLDGGVDMMAGRMGNVVTQSDRRVLDPGAGPPAKQTRRTRPQAKLVQHSVLTRRRGWRRPASRVVASFCPGASWPRSCHYSCRCNPAAWRSWPRNSVLLVGTGGGHMPGWRTVTSARR
ncbi:recombinase family protein [Streptomyces brevispora]|uniref:recombinase family protein n=1 Tax=Streptomyces brevispora TaxID=887462 RepID=UPI0037109F9E